MLKNKILIYVGVGVIIVIAYWLISPLFIDREVDEKIEDIAVEKKIENNEQNSESSGPEIVSSGTFVGLANHEAHGSAKLIKINEKYFVRFEDDFESTNGPDVYVYLGKDNAHDPKAVLGPIKGNVGGQNYEIPSTIDVSQYNEVWLWCRAFSVPFGKAQF